MKGEGRAWASQTKKNPYKFFSRITLFLYTKLFGSPMHIPVNMYYKYVLQCRLLHTL